MNAVTAQRPSTALATMNRQDLIRVLGNSLYPGATAESIGLALGYCEAAGLDPMQKPVHIVAVWDSKSGGMRDTIMPGIGLYRTSASRTGQFAGMSEPEFGESIRRTLVDKKGESVEMEFPAWCRVTVKRQLESGTIAEFTAVERWLENYATDSGKSTAPNAMWRKRPHGQLAKCAQAQALRIAFPELGAAPTAEEMEGKPMDPNVVQMGDIVEVPAALRKAASDAAAGGRATFGAFWKAATPAERELLQHELDALALKTDEAEAESKRMASDAGTTSVVAEGKSDAAEPPIDTETKAPPAATDTDPNADLRAGLDTAVDAGKPNATTKARAK